MQTTKGKKNPMDALKAALAERQAKAQKTVAETGQKWVKRGVIVQQRKDEYMEGQRQEEEKQKAIQEAHFQNLSEHFTQRQKLQPEAQEEERVIPQHILDEALLNDDDAEPPVPITEVIDRLREMAQPITLFGETDMVRYRRLRSCEKEIYEGKKNPDLVALENVHAGQKHSALRNDKNEEEAEEDNDEEEADAASEDDNNNPDAPADDKSDSEDEGEAKPTGDDKSDSEDEGDAEDQKKRVAAMQAAAAEARKKDENAEDARAVAKKLDELPEIDLKLMDRCDFIRAWCRKSLKGWEKELADMPAETKSTALVKTQLAAHRQCRRDVRPLQKRLRMYVMDAWLLDKIHIIVKNAHDLRYRDANEAYLDLSIGKACWPVGLGCGGSMLMEDAIGLHDKFNRNNQVKDIAFALNDDVTRKFVQALKRLMSVAQRFWPPDDPSMAC